MHHILILYLTSYLSNYEQHIIKFFIYLFIQITIHHPHILSLLTYFQEYVLIILKNYVYLLFLQLMYINYLFFYVQYSYYFGKLFVL